MHFSEIHDTTFSMLTILSVEFSRVCNQSLQPFLSSQTESVPIRQ